MTKTAALHSSLHYRRRTSSVSVAFLNSSSCIKSCTTQGLSIFYVVSYKKMRMVLCFCLLLVATICVPRGGSAFVVPGVGQNNRLTRSDYVAVTAISTTRGTCKKTTSSLGAATKTLPTLTEDTTWKLSFLLQGLPTEKGKKVNEIFVMDAHFIEEMGYEPPQGSIQQLSSSLASSEKSDATEEGADDEAPRFKVVSSRWQLSEDPNDRKDGLWVWGLFKEPLYPFMLLQLETDRIPLPGSEEDAILPLKLYAQLNHRREKDIGVALDGGDLKVRVIETVNADPLGAATVDIYEEISIGKLNIQARS